MRVLFLGKNHSQGLKDNDPSSLFGAAKSLNWTIVDSIDSKPDRIICVDYKKADRAKIREAQALGIPATLVINEPIVVIPEHASLSVLEMFDKVLRIGRPGKESILAWPQTWRDLHQNTDRIDAAVIVNADKWSFVTGQLYWLRGAAARTHRRLDVFGHGWNRSIGLRAAHRAFELVRTLTLGNPPSLEGIRFLLARPLSYKGEATDKIEAMSNYKVAVVIENSRELLTEKLFDAWFAGCIPVYVGPSLTSMGLRSDLAIECEPNLASVLSGVEAALERDLDSFHKDLFGYLTSPALRAKWSGEVALKAILESAI